MRFFGLVLWAACAPGSASLGGGTVPDGPGPDAPPNVLVVLLDDVGRDALAFWGDRRGAEAPNLAAVAARGVRFRHAWATPVCSSTRAALLTGRHAHRTGVGTGVSVGGIEYGLPGDERTLPERLPDHASFAVGKWHLASREQDWTTDALDQGFDRAIVTAGNLNEGNAVDGGELGYFSWEESADGEVRRREGYITSAVVDDALAISRELPEPWLGYVALHAGHLPFHVPPPELAVPRGDDAPALYRAMLTAADVELGRLLDSLEPAVRDRTVVVVLGDNGTPPSATLPRADAERAKGTLFEGGIGVPWIVAGPGVGVGDVGGPVHVTDLLPTLLGLAGVPRPSGSDPLDALDGLDLGPWLADPTAPPADRVAVVDTFGENGDPSGAVVVRTAATDGRYKLGRISAEGQVVEAVYDLTTDPGETEDRLDDTTLAPVVARLREAVSGVTALPFDHGAR
jgi:arylsulfatase A-like enzyme